MAELLYRLGRFSARRAWTVLISWVVILGLAVTAYLVAGGTLSSAISIPGTATSNVTDQLADKFPSASGGTGTVVFHTTEGDSFTSTAKSQIGNLLDTTADLAGVDAATNPFETESEIAEQGQKVTDGEQSVADGRTQLDQSQNQLNAGKQQLSDAQVQLDTARADATEAGTLERAQTQLDAQQAELDAQKQQLDRQQTALDENRATLDDQSETLDLSQRLLAMSSDIRTVSVDDSTAVANVVFDDAQLDVTPETKEEVIDHIKDAVPPGVEVEFSNELAQSTPEIFGVGEVIGLVIAAIALLVMLGTVIAAALPLLTAIVGVGVGVTASLALSGVVEMLAITPVLGVMLGLAVGIDYSLFILNRHRRQLLEGVDLHESIGLANGTSGNAVVFAGSTVLVALLALNLTGIGFLGMMGTVGAICVAVAILLAITLTPALLSLIGLRVLNKKARGRIGHPSNNTVPTKPMRTGRAVITVIASLAALAVVALPALSMRLGLPDGSSEAVDSTQYKAYQLIDEQFGAGVNGALLVVAELPDAATSDDDVLAEQVRIGETLLGVNDVVAVAPIGASDDKTVLAFQVIPDEGPSSASTEQLVRDLRDLSPLDGDVTLGVAGSASGNIDISEKLADVLPLYLGVVIGLSLIIMIFVFRSILVPLTATLGFMLSLAATFGALTAIFQWGWLGDVLGVHDPGPVLSFLPTILIGILFGLAMDYQLFLVSGMREAYAHGSSPRLAVQRGVHAGKTVVIVAAIIMVSVFGGFIFSNSAIIRSLGFGLAFGVLADAFIVRMLLIPAVMHLLGKSAWWLPKWLDRILPNIDVEGAGLERKHPANHDQLADDPGSARPGGHLAVPTGSDFHSAERQHPAHLMLADTAAEQAGPEPATGMDVVIREDQDGSRHVTVGTFIISVDHDDTAVIEPPVGGTVIVKPARRLT